MSLDNIIYLKLLNIKLENIKRKNPNNYRELIDIEQRKHSDILDFFLIICIIFIVIISLYLIYMNK